jgi:hypothetical protein
MSLVLTEAPTNAQILHIIILVNNQLDAKFFFYLFISVLYMFRATSCSSSGESIVSIQHLVCVTLCRWPSSMQVGNTRRSPTQSDTYQMLYWYNWFSWRWARGCSKHVQNWSKHTEKRIVRQVGCLQELYRDARSTEHKILHIMLLYRPPESNHNTSELTD